MSKHIANKKPIKPVRQFRAVRIMLAEDEFNALVRAAGIDERTVTDFVRLYALRAARQLCAVDDQQRVYNEIKGDLAHIATGAQSPELPFVGKLEVQK